MYNHNKSSYEQQVEIMRRCTARALDEGDVWSWDAGCEEMLENMFFTNHGITEIAHFFNITEGEVMRKVLELDLYSYYSLPDFRRRDIKCTDATKEDTFNSDPYGGAVEMMRRDTLAYDEHQFIWSEEKVKTLRMKFCVSEGITQIALAMGCTEPMVVNKILEERLYHNMDYPYFIFCR